MTDFFELLQSSIVSRCRKSLAPPSLEEGVPTLWIARTKCIAKVNRLLRFKECSISKYIIEARVIRRISEEEDLRTIEMQVFVICTGCFSAGGIIKFIRIIVEKLNQKYLSTMLHDVAVVIGKWRRTRLVCQQQGDGFYSS